MTDESRIQDLLDELFDSGTTPEVVCGAYPELLPVVRDRWRQMCRVQADLDACFPTPNDPDRNQLQAAEDIPALPSIPGYEVEAVLGRGGMGIVFRARHVRLNRSVAIKMSLASDYAGPNERERFQREAVAAAELRHPNVVQVYDVGEVDGRPYFTMELVEGGSLAHKLAGTPQPARLAANLIATLAGAVHAAHEVGVAHRDLKPANILLASDGTPKISDFGLARRLEGETSLTRTGVAVGTPSYMAPEQALGQPGAAAPAADIYALGAVLYELLTGRPPFRAESTAETLRQVIDHDPVSPSRLNRAVPRDLETVCLKCLHKDPLGRYLSAAALRDECERFLRGEGVAARPEGQARRLIRRIRRRPLLSASLVGVLLLAGVLTGALLWMLADRSAIAGAAEDDLREMARSQNAAAWSEARASLNRAKLRLNGGGPAELGDRIRLAERELALVEWLDTIRLASSWSAGGQLTLAQADAEYEDAFALAGFGRVQDNPEAVAKRIARAGVRVALVNALDDWAWRVQNPSRRDWLLRVVRLADHDETGWRESARDPATWADRSALTLVVSAAPLVELRVPLFLSLAEWIHDAAGRFEFLKRVQFAHPTDFWVNLRLGDTCREVREYQDAIRYYQAAISIRPTAAVAHNNLGMTLTNFKRYDVAIQYLREALRLDPTASPVHNNLALVLTSLHRHEEAMLQIRAGLEVHPNSPHLHSLMGGNLEALNQPDRALEAHRRAVACEPGHLGAQEGLRNCLIRKGRFDEALAAWSAALAVKSDQHVMWYGYAEFCSYLGREDAFRQARRNLLAKFGGTASPQVAERVSRACLLRPIDGDELRLGVSLAERAASTDRAKALGAYPHFQFARGLAEYRLGHFKQAIAIMQGDAAQVLGPAPGLVLAMSLHQNGQTAEGRKALADAIAKYDWRPIREPNLDGWIFHSLRREAEAILLPNYHR